MNHGQATSIRRRDFLDFSTSGLRTAAMVALLNRGMPGRAEAGHKKTLTPKARRAIHICLVGGLSQVDTFDFKPELERLHGKPFPFSERPKAFFNNVGAMRKHEWQFRQRGNSGLWVSDLFPHLATVADELTVLRSMVADSANHMPAIFQENCGFLANGYPSLGSWLSYGLGNESESLPTFVVLPDARSLPNGGASNWSSGFLPARHQGSLFHSGPKPVRNLFADNPIHPEAERDALEFLNRRNTDHLMDHQENDLLKARIQAYELAARMQVSVPEVVDFSRESPATTASYGLNRKETADFGRRCLLGRRLLERGVRFVQVFSGGALGGKPRHGWDGHENNFVNHAREALMIDQPLAALVTDLKQRGMLEDTLVLITSEFGRTPFTQAANKKLGLGRDHNPEGFTVCLAGAGLKKGFAFGETDEIGWRSVVDSLSWPDFHATVLHLLGIDHESLTYYHNGIARRLTNVHGKVIADVLA